MTRDQERELIRHMAKIDEKGNTLVKGSMTWVINEALDNIRKLEDLIGVNVNRPSKKDIKPVLRDLRDQLRELKIRLD